MMAQIAEEHSRAARGYPTRSRTRTPPRYDPAVGAAVKPIAGKSRKGLSTRGARVRRMRKRLEAETNERTPEATRRQLVFFTTRGTHAR